MQGPMKSQGNQDTSNPQQKPCPCAFVDSKTLDLIFHSEW